MNIKITLNDCSKFPYMANCTDLPGSPPVGYGETVNYAIGQLIIQLAYDTESNWFKYIKDVKITIEMPEGNPAVKW